MLFKIICVGKIKEEYYSSQIQELCKQINKKNRVEIIQSEDEKIPKNASDAVKQKKSINLYFSMFQYIILKVRNNRCLINILQSCHVEESFPGRSCNLYD